MSICDTQKELNCINHFLTIIVKWFKENPEYEKIFFEWIEKNRNATNTNK